MTQVQSKMSLEAFLELPETKPASEYINGEIYQKPMPQGKHSRIQARLSMAINQVAEEQQLAAAFTELRCTFGGRSIVPDIAVFGWERIPLDANGEIENAVPIAPDWTIEILSPDQNISRVIEKILLCLNYGAKLGWLIDPQEKLVLVFKPQQQPEPKEHQDILPVLEVLAGWQLTAADLFSWLSFNKT